MTAEKFVIWQVMKFRQRMEKSIIGMIGLGKMGGNLALQAIDKGYTVVAYETRHNDELEQKGVQYQNSTEEMLQKLSSPKIVFICARR